MSLVTTASPVGRLGWSSSPVYSDLILYSYDLLNNQVVLCSEKCSSLAKVTTILSHELVHMYDNCVAKVDWSNINQLACSEVDIIILTLHCIVTVPHLKLDPSCQPRSLCRSHIWSSGGRRPLGPVVWSTWGVCQKEGGKVREGHSQV